MGAGRLEEGLITGLTLTEHMVLAAPEHEFIIDWKSAQKETSEKIEIYQVVGSQDSTADQLSGGNQQRFMFSLMRDKLKLILLEHPTRGLDVRPLIGSGSDCMNAEQMAQRSFSCPQTWMKWWTGVTGSQCFQEDRCPGS